MNFDSALAFDGRPSSSELFHHLFPNEKGLISDLLHSILSLFLEQIKPEVALDDSCLCHQELKVSVSDTGFVHAPVFLYDGGCQDWTFMSFESQGRDFNLAANFIFIDDAFKELLFSVLCKVC